MSTTYTMLQARGHGRLAAAIASGTYIPPAVLDAIPVRDDGDWSALDRALRAQRADGIADLVMSGVESNVALADSDYKWDPQQALDVYAEIDAEDLAADPVLERIVLDMLELRLAAAQAEHEAEMA